MPKADGRIVGAPQGHIVRRRNHRSIMYIVGDVDLDVSQSIAAAEFVTPRIPAVSS